MTVRVADMEVEELARGLVEFAEGRRDKPPSIPRERLVDVVLALKQLGYDPRDVVAKVQARHRQPAVAQQAQPAPAAQAAAADGGRAAARSSTGGDAELRREVRGLLREVSEVRKILEERIPARVPSFLEFAKAVVEEYWKLGGSFVNYEKLRQAVCARLLIPSEAFDTWFNDLVWLAKGRLSVHESRTEKGLVIHVLTHAKTHEELLWGR